MDKKMFKIGFLAGVLLIIGIGIYGYFNMKSVMNDNTIKPIELVQLDLEKSNGEKIILKNGKPIVINFWATWCVPCVQEFPEFEELNKKYSDKVDFLMISDEENSKIEKFKAKKGYNLNMVRSLKTFEKYGLMLRPATYFYDSNGKLVSKFAGGITKEELENEIKKIIEN
jgi:cytochrome c biogenesis protein CcmG/thiol:disulfide interchange protein DsbE